ncbi:N-terminal Xaa-Pro-Lys N-methyltransferase 1 isoform X1 [Tribolium madens]|uniref:N-terminal Xaa-Pro-Lys N-methyltransferase 1 isoform X1 n=1 Tax=Tribolium madens TaxID=41895 RepID=UPI001CF729C7|nr:N-terminal Xaa-Pro-Lys N-methyltransferase 1 isoform X1 [Tribolium madens]
MDVSGASVDDETFYSNAVQYWSEIPPTIDGMLGGFGHISQTDIRDSKLLLKQLFNSKEPPGREYALDCGAGIGRITKHLLCDFFDNVDLVEQNPKFLSQAEQYLGVKLQEKIRNYYSVGLQSFKPETGKYDVIWCQWVLGHLTDLDLVTFLESCQSGLKLNGVIIIKENISSSDEIDKDERDSSVTRPLSLYREIFTKAGLDCYRQVKQRNFPKGLYTVYMFILRPQKLVPE